MTNEDIKRAACDIEDRLKQQGRIFGIPEETVEDIRAVVLQAYEAAAKAQCDYCRFRGASMMIDGKYQHPNVELEEIRPLEPQRIVGVALGIAPCHAAKIWALRDALVSESVTSA